MKSALFALFLLFLVPASFGQDSESAPVKIYPNPTSHEITIEGYTGSVERLVIYDSFGESVRDDIRIVEHNETKLVIDLSSLNRGVYYFKANSHIEKVFKE